MYYAFIAFAAFTLKDIAGQNVRDKILNYFNSDSVRTFERRWQKYQIPMENAVLLALKEIYGHKGMNVYIRKMRNPHKINKGYYHSDNQVQIILTELDLDNLPHIWMPQLTFPLPSNVLRLDASLSKLIVRCNYTVFRNMSNIIYDLKDQNYYKNSPFAYQQTKNVGQLAIIMEGCILSGFTVATLNGPSVNLGHDNFNIYNCHHTFEIYNSGMQSPPVFASYYPEGEGLNIEHLLMTSLREELIPKLQAAMFSYINTTAIFGRDLTVIRDTQEDIFRQTAIFMNDVTRNMNKITVERNIATVSMEDFRITWDDLLAECLYREIKLNKMVLTGLDTAYSSHTGGPISVPVTCLAEEIRFERLQIYGIVEFNGGKHASHNFSVEIKDTAVSVLMELNTLRTIKRTQDNLPLKSKKAFEVTGWRSFEFSASGDEIISTEALVTGHILKILPKYITEHLNRVYYEAVNKANSKSHDVKSSVSDENTTEGLIESKEVDSDLQDIQGIDNDSDSQDIKAAKDEKKRGKNEDDSQDIQGMDNDSDSQDIKAAKDEKERGQNNDDSQDIQGTDNGEDLEQGTSDSQAIQGAENGGSVPNSDDSHGIRDAENVEEQEQNDNNSRGKTKVENEEELDESENDGILSAKPQNQNKTFITSNEDETQGNEEDGINESHSLQKGVKSNSNSGSVEIEQEVSNSEISSENEPPGEVQADDIEEIEKLDEVKDHLNDLKNKSIIITSSEIVHINSNNISRGDLVHFSYNEIRSDF